MVKLLVPCVVIGLSLAGSSGARAEESAKVTIAKAIEAHGGAARIDRRQAVQARARTILTVGDTDIPVQFETFVQLPGKFKNVMQMEFQGQKVMLIQVLDGDQGWININGQTQVANEQLLAQMKEGRFAEQVIRLTPLLRDTRFELSALGETQVNDRPVIGVKVAHEGFNDIHVYFDKATRLVVKTQRRTLDSSMKEVLQEEFYGDYREIDGVKRPMKVLITHDGKKFMQGEMIEVKPLDRFDDGVFARP
jgi:hypothetical protein